MTKPLSLFLFIALTLAIQAQESNRTTNVIDDIEHAKDYLDITSTNKGKIVIFNEEKHKTKLAKSLFELAKGGVLAENGEFETTHYKVLDKIWIPSYRASYIYLDGNQLTQKDINVLRETIIKKYQNGAPFDFLAKHYSMDENASKGGDTGWFSEDNHTFDFEDAIINDNYELDDIFTIDIIESKKYYVILKTHEPKNISEIKVLKTVEAID